MLKSKTLLVLGAGASKEANLPIGVELMPAILSSVRIEPRDFAPPRIGEDLQRALHCQEQARSSALSHEIQHYSRAYLKMTEGLKLSISIDNYLDAHQSDYHLQVLGKMGIVMSILKSEKSSQLSIGAQNKCDVLRVSNKWYAELFKIMNEGISRDGVDKFFDSIEIISFNYDRCIEHFFERALQSYYSIDNTETARAMARLKIHHPYGQVGHLPWQNFRTPTPFGSDQAGGSELVRLASQIKTFTERQDDMALVERMQQAVQSAETIVFLGFAFHPQNLELIAPTKPGRAKRVFASAYGMSKPDIRATRDDIQKWLKRENEHLSIEIEDLTCAKLFAEYRRSIPRA
ncbi:hypothetical protein [Bosea rubneri]|uniref:SIR2-like domain-containing protein n=1 Tax=Bosea rubneri TaxID=3075434 RepID=A0ABU3S469_9HYPH|nr:hypothetical protein [Bosea sp. ZW T0_25]MDU0339562.1 hypothetical protein [Bosea sp. ZW T0_25]